MTDKDTFLNTDDSQITAKQQNSFESQQWHTTFDAIADAICLLDTDGRLMRFNKAFKEFAGKAPEELIGLHCWEIVHGTAGFVDNCPVMRALKSHQRENLALDIDGSWFDISVDPILDDAGQIVSFVHIMRDITEHKHNESRINKLNRIYRVMGSINQTIIRSSEPEMILNDACRIAVVEGGFRMAWIGLVDKASGKVEVVATAGEAGNYLENVNVSLGDSPERRGPTVSALLTGKHVICNDIEHDHLIAPWRDNAMRLGYRASVALPLVVDGEVRGTFNLYAEDPGFFDGEEEDLLVGLAADISFALEVAEREDQRRRAKKALIETTERLTAVMDSVNALIYVADLETYEILFINEYGRNIWGDVAGKICWKTLQEGQTGPCDFCTNDKLLNADGTPTGGYVWEVRNTMTGHWYDCRDQAIRWSDGRLVRMEIATDITESKEAARSLAANEAHLRTLVETIPGLIWLKDANGVYLTCNKMFERFFGAKEGDIVGKTDYDFVDREQADFFRKHDRKAIAAGKASVNEEWITFAEDGQRVLLETIKTPMCDTAGRLIGVLGIGRDITGQRKLEEQLHHSQKMESIGTLAGGIAHDFNNILTAIIGYAHITFSKMPEGDPHRYYVGQILAASDRAAHLTRDLLLFSRKQSSERKTIDLNETIRKVEVFLKRIIRADIDYKTNLQNSALPLFADSHQLEQVLLNLATNACDAMPNGGTFAVSTDQANLDQSFNNLYGYGKPGQYARITVSDTGLGMDEKTRLRIFEPFFTTKEVGKGTGLGLAVVYGIIKQHEGFVNVCSEVGIGTTFQIYLPIVTTEAVKVTSGHQLEHPVGGTERILLAEDDEMVRSLTTSVLEEYGYKVITAVDGADAVRKFAENMDAIDLIILDLIMPNSNGNKALSEIRTMRPAVKAIFISGYESDSLSHQASTEEGVPLLFKPTITTDLLRAVRSQLDGRAAAS